ncbi:helicase-related protein [Bacillus wiedmannii]|uniref:helicase-related protein n=1 Tax=Bacillus wiedmannii TaxID=1890302 RepID=UPI0007DB3077|nr:helicase-related protein [Bacillus wiedmannii]OAK46938.1 helicase [Bacillus wiedmannii]HDR7661448.1 DEAD/DEAH box helicase family protein [Bacillus wiedmannii]
MKIVKKVFAGFLGGVAVLGKMLDNKKSGIVGDALKPYFKKDAKVAIMSSYFTIYAFEALKKELMKVAEVRFLFIDPTFTSENSTNEFLNYGKSEREKKLSGSELEIKMRNELTQAKIAKECANWISSKVKMKSLTSTLTQTRMFHIENKDDSSVAIQGSLDFTSSGLGYTYSPNLQMNTLMDEPILTKQYIQWFNDVWNNEAIVEEVKEEVLDRIAVIYQNHSPEFLYYVTLYNIFSDYLEEFDEDTIVKSKTGFKDTAIWNKLYKFQKDGVLGAIDKLEKHNGCIIADSVGLGKTFEALAVIKYYELRNDRVLVLCPKKLRENWLIYTQNDKRNILSSDRFNYDVLNHTDLSRTGGLSGDINLTTVNWSNYDLVVIDESHNFRNNQARTDRETRYSRLMNQVIKAGVKTKVLMLSATPVNNKMNDLKNQVAFITEGRDEALEAAGIENIEQTLRKAQLSFNKWLNLDSEHRKTETLLEMLNFDYFKLLDAVTIARSRKHIEKYYNMSEIGKFPERLKPKNVYADIDEYNEFPAIKEVNTLINRLNLSAYSPLKYVLPEKQEEYSRKYDRKVKGGSVFKQIDRERSLVHLMRVNLLKRMESSIHSFGKTVASLLIKIDDLLMKLDNIKKYSDENININDIDIDDEDVENMLIGSKVKVLFQDIDRIKWRQDLQDDREKLEKLLIETAKIQIPRDAKLNKLKTIIEEKINHPINGSNKKMIVFTAFADTASYLYEELSKWLLERYGVNTALVTGSGGNKTTLNGIQKELNSILTHFSPVSKERSKVDNTAQEEIDLLIATDCISEGQNLQDCDYLVNYDIHWNPVRIIQRFGRIDRLGSKNDFIQLVNFWPNMDLDEYINLESRVSGRMVLLDISATGEENVIEYNETKKMNDLEYRAKQLKQLQEEVIDLEDISGGISITDLTLNDFKMDLVEYMQLNKKRIETAPLGLHAVTSVHLAPSTDTEQGVIFCIKQRNAKVKVKETSALYPYYLIFMNMEGEVQLGHLKTKQILDLYRKVAHGQTEVFNELIHQFNSETSELTDMSSYKYLLDKAMEFVLGIVEEKGMESLFSLGNSILLQDTITTSDDFELVSFFVIK